MFQVGTLKDSGQVVEAGGIKAIIRVGWNAWVFCNKCISIYAPHCLSDQAQKGWETAQAANGRIQRSLNSCEKLLREKEQALSDLEAARQREQEKNQSEGSELRTSLQTLQAEFDEATACSNTLNEKVLHCGLRGCTVDSNASVLVLSCSVFQPLCCLRKILCCAGGSNEATDSCPATRAP